MKRAKSTTGVVHCMESVPSFPRGGFSPLCNCYSGWGWGWKTWRAFGWVKTDEPATCKHCLRKAGKALYLANGVFHRLGSLDRVIQRKFMTKGALDAYLQGLKDGKRCNRIEVNGSTI